MPRIQPVNSETADAKTIELLNSVEKKMGMVPNIISTMANSPAVANAYLGFAGSLGGGTLSAPLREKIALVVGETNSCGYCVSAHTALGNAAGIEDESVLAARQGKSPHAQEETALQFAQKLVRQQGKVSDADLAELRTAGFSDGEISELVANVALNIFTNYFNHVAETEIDFPVATALAV